MNKFVFFVTRSRDLLFIEAEHFLSITTVWSYILASRTKHLDLVLSLFNFVLGYMHKQGGL
jgi:hypothetical protein